MAKVRMIGQISGTRDGKDWPLPGGVIDVPKDEAAQLIASRIAEDFIEAAVVGKKAETAAVPNTPTKRGLTTASLDK